MKLAVVKDVEVAPLNILAYVDDDSKHLIGEEITRLVKEIIKFAPATYNIDDVREALENAVSDVYETK